MNRGKNLKIKGIIIIIVVVVIPIFVPVYIVSLVVVTAAFLILSIPMAKNGKLRKGWNDNYMPFVRSGPRKIRGIIRLGFSSRQNQSD